MALPVLTPEQRQASLAKAREVRTARSALLAELRANTVTLADVLGREDDLARRTKVSQVLRAVPASARPAPPPSWSAPGSPLSAASAALVPVSASSS